MSDEANVGSAELFSTEVQGRDAEDSNKGSQSGIIKLDAIRRIIDKVNASVIPLMQRSLLAVVSVDAYRYLAELIQLYIS